MKRILMVFSLAGAFSLVAAETNVSDRKAVLTQLITDLNRKPTESERWMGEHAAWYDATTHKALENYINQNTNTAEALTAQLWLSLAKTSTDQGSISASRQHAAEFQTIITRAPSSWQAKTAHLGRCGALLVGRQWDDLSKEIGGILSAITEYKNETNPEFLRFLKATGIEPAEMEPNLKNILMIGASNEGKLDKALQLAQELQGKFPEWSKKNRIEDEIARLKKGENYDSLPSR